MRHYSFVSALCLLLIGTTTQYAQAKARFLRVTPSTQHQSPYVLAVAAHRSRSTTQFKVLIQAQHGYTLSPFHTAFVNKYGQGIKFDRWQTPNADPQSSFTVASSSTRGGLHYEFSVPNSQLSSTIFIYETEGSLVEHGKVRMMRSADFCWFRCRNFVHREG